MNSGDAALHPVPPETEEWWRSAVVNEIYPHSFADTNGDGIGDIEGMTARLCRLDRTVRMGDLIIRR